MELDHMRACLLLHSLPQLQNHQRTALLTHCGSVADLWQSDPRSWPELGISPATLSDFHHARKHGEHRAVSIDIVRQLASLRALDVTILAVSDPDYPPLLRTIYDPPALLYVRGNKACLRQPQLAVVGSRRASAAGLKAAAELSGAAVAAGLQICSGLALGIDAAAHLGALEAGGDSIAVMATGIDDIYPRRHRELATRLVSSGCLVTEFPPGSPPRREHFPRRNRIISGLSLGVLVVEAALPSGSLITAGTALEQGREVFALPWSRDHANGRGCLHLLRDGAVMVLSIEDILMELGALFALQQELPLATPGDSEAAEKVAAASAVSAGQRQLLQLIGSSTVSAEELAQRSILPLTSVLANLSSLELDGHIVRTAGGYSRG